METSDLDIPLLPSAEQIRRREFATIRRGYDPDQVRDYLAQVAAQVDTLEKELRGEGGEVPARPTGIEALVEMADVEAPDDVMVATTDDPYQRVAQRFAVVFETADSEAEEVVARARTEAEQLVGDARSEADRIRVDAQARAEEARQEGREALDRARREADETLGDLDAKRASLVSELDGMRAKLLSVADDLVLPLDADDVEVTGNGSALPGTTAEVDPWLPEGLEIPELELSDLDVEGEERG